MLLLRYAVLMGTGLCSARLLELGTGNATSTSSDIVTSQDVPSFENLVDQALRTLQQTRPREQGLLWAATVSTTNGQTSRSWSGFQNIEVEVAFDLSNTIAASSYDAPENGRWSKPTFSRYDPYHSRFQAWSWSERGMSFEEAFDKMSEILPSRAFQRVELRYPKLDPLASGHAWEADYYFVLDDNEFAILSMNTGNSGVQPGSPVIPQRSASSLDQGSSGTNGSIATS